MTGIGRHRLLQLLADAAIIAVSWVLARAEVTGLATAGDVRLLGMTVAAERDRMDPAEAAALLLGDTDYSSPFLAMPF